LKLVKEKEDKNDSVIFRYFAKDAILLATCRAFLPPFRSLPPSRSYELLFNEACVSAAPRLFFYSRCGFGAREPIGQEEEYESSSVQRMSERSIVIIVYHEEKCGRFSNTMPR